MLERIHITYEELLSFALRKLKKFTKSLNLDDNKFLMRKRRQFNNIKSANDSRKRQRTEMKRLRAEKIEIQKHYENKLETTKKSLEDIRERKEQEIAKQCEVFQSQIKCIIDMLKQGYQPIKIEDELQRLAQDISYFSERFGYTSEPLDLSIK